MTPLLNVDAVTNDLESPHDWMSIRVWFDDWVFFSSAADHIGAVQQGAGCNQEVLRSCHLQ
jgi:hypothetical protein